LKIVAPDGRFQGGVVIDELDNMAAQPQPEAALPPAGAESHGEIAPHAEPQNAAQHEADARETPQSAAEAPAGKHQPTTEPTAASAPNGRLASIEPAEEEAIRKEWYILKVQSNREESIKEGLMRRVRAAGLDRYFGECIVPTEMVSEFKGGKKRVTKRKLYPGYLVVHMEINDDTWYLVRETTGIGDFTGSVGRPTPMLAQDVQKILSKSEEKTDEAPKLKISFKKGDRVKINEGTFENFEGDVDAIDEANGRVIVMINIFGRSTPVELEYWQIEAL
jgi:transcription termination/antitermination protein NusG